MDIKDLSGLFQQAKEMHDNMAKLQSEAANIEVEGQSGGGLVRVKANGAMDLLRIDIDPSLMSSGDKEMLEDLLAAAVNDAVRRGEELSKEKMAGFTAGLNLPPGFKMPF